MVLPKGLTTDPRFDLRVIDLWLCAHGVSHLGELIDRLRLLWLEKPKGWAWVTRPARS